MDREDRRSYRAAAESSLAAATYDPKKLVLMHTGTMLALSLLTGIAGFLLERGIAGSGGLGGLGLRGILTTVGVVLNLLSAVVLPFWQIGYVFITLQIARGKPVGPGALWEGFRKCLLVLRLKLLIAAMYGLILFLTAQVGSMVFMMTPWANPFMSAMMAYYEDPKNAALAAALDAAAVDAALPMLVIMGVLFLLFAGPMFYRYRFAEFFLMERPLKGAFGAIRASSQLTHGQKLGILKLDVSFWWYYLLSGVSVALAYGDMVLPWFDITLPISEEVFYFVGLGLYAVTQLALHWWRKNEVSVTYAQLYTDLQGPPPENTLEPKKNPWG